MEADSDKMEVVLRSDVELDMSSFFNNEELSDVVLVVGDKKLHAHRLVLAKSSSVFKTMLYGKHWSECDGGEVKVIETQECQAVFHLFIEYLYSAQIPINVQSTVGILCLADKYDVDSLKDLCVSYAVKQARLVPVCTALTWSTWAKAMNLSLIVFACTKAVLMNAKLLMQSPMWVDLDVEYMADILSHSDLVIDEEYDLFLGLSQWLLCETHMSCLKENSERLLPLIRFPQMQASELLGAERTSLATHIASSGKLSDLIGRAYRFKALRLTDKSVDFSDTFYKPRDYLTLKVYSFLIKFPLVDGQPMQTSVSGGENRRWKITSHSVDCERSIWNIILWAKEKEDLTQVCLLVTDEEDRVIQSKRTTNIVCQKGTRITVQLRLHYPGKANRVLVLIKPML